MDKRVVRKDMSVKCVLRLIHSSGIQLEKKSTGLEVRKSGSCLVGVRVICPPDRLMMIRSSQVVGIVDSVSSRTCSLPSVKTPAPVLSSRCGYGRHGPMDGYLRKLDVKKDPIEKKSVQPTNTNNVAVPQDGLQRVFIQTISKSGARAHPRI